MTRMRAGSEASRQNTDAPHSASLPKLLFCTDGPVEPQARELLERMIQAMGLKREDVAIAAAGSAEPLPRVVVALGESATRKLLQSEAGLSEVRGKFQPFRGAKLMPTFDLSFLLQKPEAKKDTWADLKAVARELGISL